MSKNNTPDFDFNTDFIFTASPPDDGIPDKSYDESDASHMSLLIPLDEDFLDAQDAAEFAGVIIPNRTSKKEKSKAKEEKAKSKTEAKAKTEAEAKAEAEAEAKAKVEAEAEAKAKAEAEAKAKAEAEAKAKAEAEAKAKAEAEAKAKAEAEAKAKAKEEKAAKIKEEKAKAKIEKAKAKEEKAKKEPSTPAFIISITLKLLLICAVVAAMLAVAYSITAPIIAQNELEKKEAALKDIFPELTEYQVLESENESYSAVYTVKSEDEYVGYTAEVSPKGFGGSVNLIIGIDLDRCVRGIKVISHSETPSVGTKALADSYLSGYSTLGGESLALGTDIDAVSGATITSKAINSGVNTCLAIYDDIIAVTGKPEPEPPVVPEPVVPEKAVFTKERVLEGMYGWEDGGNGVIEIPVDTTETPFSELSYLAVSDGSLVGYLAKIKVVAGEFDYADLMIGTYFGRIQGVRFIDYSGDSFDKLANALHEYIVPNYKYDINKTEFIYGENVEVFEEADAEARLIADAVQTVLEYNQEFNKVIEEVRAYE